MRADQWLVERGLAASRSQAQRLIASGARWRVPRAAAQRADDGWRPLAKADDLPATAEVELASAAESRYVSRGGLKLEAALAASGVTVTGRDCLDVGQSTGGFTDALLQAGAAHVLGIDVGHGQLHPRLREDPRVDCVEGCNARHLTPDLIAVRGDIQGKKSQKHPKNQANNDLSAGFSLVVGDLSFISLTLVLPALAPLLAAGGDLLMLVKPQFELQSTQLGKGGIVRDATLFSGVRERIETAVRQTELHVAGWYDSPISGGDGNREFFIHGRKPLTVTPT